MILKYYPVCECGHIFKEFKCIEDKQEFKNKNATTIIYAKYLFSPKICPKCRQIINGIEITDPRK